MEEIEAAKNAEIEVEVIPGISSAIAVPASKMIPLTCRGINESFWVTTGATQSGEISGDIKLAALSNATVDHFNGHEQTQGNNGYFPGKQ